MKVVILGAGFGGLELASRLSAALGDEVEVDLLDQAAGFIFGFSKLDVMFGKASPDQVFHHYSALAKPGVRFTQTTIRAFDPSAKTVETDAGTYSADVVVVALGADLDPAATPGLVEHGHDFYTVTGAFALREVLEGFEGGRIVVGVTSTPFKCPPAPSETALLLHDYLTARSLRQRSEIALVMPLGVPIPPSPGASAALLEAFAERHIEWHPERLVTELSAEPTVAHLSDGDEMAFDLFLGVPKHKVPEVVEQAGMAVDGWIPVDPLTLETTFADVYAVGDVTSVGTPKAGVFSEGQAVVVADAIIARARGEAPSTTYQGRGVCYLEFGDEMVATVDVTFLSGMAPEGQISGPSRELAASKREFGVSRIDRWFDRTWDVGTPSPS
jgi:sulfide:quinone oxidoreductase